MEAILLAGGLGTRLHAVTGDKYPKCLAKVDGKPFIFYLIDFLQRHGITNFIFAVSHHADMVKDAIDSAYPSLAKSYSVEEQPLGTGGAIKQALSHATGEKVLVLNADSFVEFDVAAFIAFSKRDDADLSMVCIEVSDIGRFGAAQINDDCLTGFSEKGGSGSGYINAGVYCIKRKHPAIALYDSTSKFSFESDILSDRKNKVGVYKTKGLFFDIGTPDDFALSHQLVSINKQVIEQ